MMDENRPFFSYSVDDLDRMIQDSIDEIAEIESGPLPEDEDDQECQDQCLEIASWCISACRREKEIRAEQSAHEAMRDQAMRENPPPVDYGPPIEF